MTRNDIRPVRHLIRGERTSDGAGVRLTRLLGHETVEAADPFLMLDHFDTERADDYIGGFPSHPHRGFETVTYMLDGRMRHGDNKGHSGVIASGDVQWMTAGSGIVHSEMPEQEEGLMRGFQLWVNLPARDKMTPARYQEIPAATIPVETRGNGTRVKVIAGATGEGTQGPIDSGATEARFLDIRLAPGARIEEAVPAALNALLVVYDGAIVVGEVEKVAAVNVAILGEGGRVAFENAGRVEAGVLLIAGKPLNEPIAWGGPFVMNTRDEVMQAARDYQAGRF
ncbi:pirin family protein [Zavarzinia aquatilis]|uniref:Quercetin 2,3-dioxygenase n=1 Tax=Zavarzinia aquatilis TaxID=2211142 RepID=A0A317EB10_9PROT|nr:pirin family protein [Zavarzinia aquatilis]PWR24298.1 quercetin 2,3-dioxygenase [Zavarzinia aquatilis]